MLLIAAALPRFFGSIAPAALTQARYRLSIVHKSISAYAPLSRRPTSRGNRDRDRHVSPPS